MEFLKKFNKCFQIGFDKCGTTSLQNMFEEAGLKTVHYGGGNWASCIDFNVKNKRPLLEDMTHIDCYTDISNFWTNSYPFVKYFKILDAQYPNSIFILNTRDVEKWLESRKNFQNSVLCRAAMYHFRVNTPEQVVAIWKAQHDAHVQNVREYFKDSDRFCEFRIETEGEKIEKFMEYWGVKGCVFPHSHKSKP